VPQVAVNAVSRLSPRRQRIANCPTTHRIAIRNILQR
jgi:hypothetical protein